MDKYKSWMLLGPSYHRIANVWDVLGTELLVLSWLIVRHSWAILGTPWSYLGSCLGPSWSSCKLSRCILEDLLFGQKNRALPGGAVSFFLSMEFKDKFTVFS